MGKDFLISSPAEHIATERLSIRRWHPDDAPLLRAAIDCGMDHLLAWLPWGHLEPADLEATRDRLLGYRAAFASGDEFVYGVFDPSESEVIGGVGLYPRIGEGGLEIGYWVREDRTNRGYATEATRALTAEGFEMDGVDRLQIHVDVRNMPSRAIPEKLGYRLVVKRMGDTRSVDGKARDVLIYRMTREEWTLARRADPTLDTTAH